MEEEVERIVERVLAGEVDAYAGIVRRYQKDVWRMAACMLRDLARTEEIVQQTFVNAYVHLERYERGRNFGVWIRAIARNLVRNEIRRSLRDEKKMRHYRQWLLLRLDDEGCTCWDEEVRRALAKCREELSPSAGEALRLRYDLAWSYRKVAEKIGRTVAATRQMIARVRAALKKCIRERISPT